MLEFLHGRASDRKLRLFAVACCRTAPNDFIDDARVREAIETSERYADGLATREQLRAARKGALSRLGRYVCHLQPWHAVWLVMGVLLNLTAAPLLPSMDEDHWFDGYFRVLQQASGRHCPLLHDLFGPLPFRQVPFDPAWRTPDVRRLAEAIYQERALDRLPILADALEEGGCTDADILADCRGTGPHTRGCWTVDLLLGKV
jgi:hypothetical protein